MDTPKMSLKLLVDNKGSRVLFAEVPKEFVDFLFGIFSMTFGTLVEFDGVGSLGKLKDSVQSFHENYLQPGIKVDNIFKPKTAFNSNTFFLSNSVDQSDTESKVYTCSNTKTFCSDVNRNLFAINQYSMLDTSNPCRSYMTLHVNTICPSCHCLMNVPMMVVKPKTVVKTNEADKNKIGYVKEMVTYMVMDDLVVKPMSTISSITLLNKCGVNDLSQLEEKMVSFGKEEGVKLLNASLKTDKVLTSIFMS